jgi:hypothetical protein
MSQITPANNFVLGLPSAISAALFIATLWCLAKKRFRKYGMISAARLFEITFYSSLIASVLTVMYGFVTREILVWPSVISGAYAIKLSE